MEVFKSRQLQNQDKFKKFSNAEELAKIVSESFHIDILERFSKTDIEEDYLLDVIKIMSKISDRKLAGVIYNIVINEVFMAKKKRIEMLKILSTAKDGRFAYEAAEVILNSNYDDDILLEIIKIITQSKNEFAAESTKKLALTPEVINHPKAFEVLRVIASIDGIWSDVLDASQFALKSGVLIYENADIILGEYVKVKRKSKFVIDNVMNVSSNEEEAIKIISIVADYKSVTKLKGAADYMFASEEVFNDPLTKELALQTFEYFAGSSDETTLFACTELFNEETDPTIGREIEKNNRELLSLSRDVQIKILEQNKRLIDEAKKVK